MRAVHFDGAPMGEDFTTFMDLCVQCRACEVVCPSSVPFGHLMEGARETLAERTRYQPWWRRIGHRLLAHHRLVMAGSSVLAVGQRLGVNPRRLALPRLAVRRPRLRPTGSDVWLFTGCVMDAWQRDVHEATIRVLGAAGAGVMLPGRGSDCCGALAMHAGLDRIAARMAVRVMGSMPGDAPVLVNSAGCGAALKDVGRTVGTPAAVAFAARVLDVHEWLAGRVDRLPSGHLGLPVAVQDPCHLRHVQRAHHHVRTVLAPFAELRELDDDGLCCGAGGAYATFHPDMAAAIRDRKVAAIERSGASVVASANPGCALHLAAAGVDARHPMTLIDEAIHGSAGGG